MSFQLHRSECSHVHETGTSMSVKPRLVMYREYEIIKMKSFLRLKDQYVYWLHNCWGAEKRTECWCLGKARSVGHGFCCPHSTWIAFRWTDMTKQSYACIFFWVLGVEQGGWHSTWQPSVASDSRTAQCCPPQRDVLAYGDALLCRWPLSLPVSLVPLWFTYLLKDLWDL